MRPLEVLSDTALRYSWTSYHPAALLWRTSYWHTHERFAVIANMFTDSSVPAFHGAILSLRFIIRHGGAS